MNKRPSIMTHHNKGKKHAAKPPELRRDERFTTRCNLVELEGYRMLKKVYDKGRKLDKEDVE